MKVYVCTDHEGFWPVGVASIVVANDGVEATELLYTALRARGLTQDIPFTLCEVDTSTPKAEIFRDGDY